jgi:competence protein ComGC
MEKRGATLLELSIVIAIIGTLTIFGMRYFRQERDDVRYKVTKAKIKQLKDAIVSYYAEYNHFPQDIADLKPKYIRDVPVKTGWKTDIEMVEDSDIPKLRYRILYRGVDQIITEPVVPPWKEDVYRNLKLKDIFDMKHYPSKIMVGKSSVYSYKDDEEFIGKDEYGRDLPNDMYGEYVFGASMEIWILAPDDPETSANDPGHDFKFSITSGEIVDILCDDPNAEYENSGSEFSGKSNKSLVHYEFGIDGCSYATLFTLEVFKPRMTDTKIFYGSHEIFSVPELELEAHTEGTQTVYLRPEIPVIVNRPLYEDTRKLN